MNHRNVHLKCLFHNQTTGLIILKNVVLTGICKTGVVMILSGCLVTLGGGLVRKHRATAQNTRSHRTNKCYILNTLANMAHGQSRLTFIPLKPKLLTVWCISCVVKQLNTRSCSPVNKWKWSVCVNNTVWQSAAFLLQLDKHFKLKVHVRFG